MSKPFILNDESRVNSHGFVVLNAGGKFDRFKSNPVMLHGHDQQKLIGRWDNLHVEGKHLMADPVFDEADDDAKKIQGKVDRGFLKGASMGIQIEDAELRTINDHGLVPFVTKWELLETSLAAVPSNDQCLRVYSPKGELLGSSEAIKLSIDNLINKNKIDNSMDKIMLTAEAATALKVSKEPELTALNAAILELSIVKLKAEKELSDYRLAQAKALLDGAIADGRITADKRESFEKLAVSDFKQAKDLIDSLPAKKTFTDKMKAGKSAGESREGWDYLRWAREDPRGLLKMQTEDPTRLAQLKADYQTQN